MDPVVFKEFGKLFVRFGGFEPIAKSDQLRELAPNDFRNASGYVFRDSFAWDSLVAIAERKSHEGHQLVFVFPSLQTLSPSFKTEAELKGWKNAFEARIKAAMLEVPVEPVEIDKDGVGGGGEGCCGDACEEEDCEEDDDA